MVLFCTLEFLINALVCLLIFDQFSHQYALIWTSTFIFYEQLMILYFCKWPIFIRNCIFEPIILYQYVYLEQYVYLFWQNFSPVLLFGPVRLLGTLEYLLNSWIQVGGVISVPISEKHYLVCLRKVNDFR